MTEQPEVRAAQAWRTNADLMADVHRLFPLDEVRDVTYGRGKWWTVHTPAVLVGSDLHRKLTPVDGRTLLGIPLDFRYLPDPSNRWPVVAFDPPYIPQSKRQARHSTITEFHDRFGLDVTPADTPASLRALIAAGIAEAARVTKPRGYVLVKCMNYVFSRKHQPQVAWAIADAEAAGLTVAAQFIHLGKPGSQPANKRNGEPRAVWNVRANYSVLLVLRKPYDHHTATRLPGRHHRANPAQEMLWGDQGPGRPRDGAREDVHRSHVRRGAPAGAVARTP